MELQYDGTGLHGWAKQDGLQTVEGCLEEALRTAARARRRCCGWPGAPTPACMPGARWSAFCCPTGWTSLKLRRSLNALTPAGIAVLDLRPAPAAFDARKDATSRSYRYFLSTQPGGVALLGRLLLAGVRRRSGRRPHGRGGRAGRRPPPLHRLHPDRDEARLLRPHGAAVPLDAGERCGIPGAALGAGARAGRGGAAAACSAWRSKPTPSCATWCVPWWATMIEVGRGERSLEDFARLSGWRAS